MSAAPLPLSTLTPSTSVTPAEHETLLTRAFGCYHSLDERIAVSEALGAAYRDIYPESSMTNATAAFLSQLAQKLVERGVLIILP